MPSLVSVYNKSKGANNEAKVQRGGLCSPLGKTRPWQWRWECLHRRLPGGREKECPRATPSSGFGCLVKIKFRIFYWIAFSIPCLLTLLKISNWVENWPKVSRAGGKGPGVDFTTQKCLRTNYSDSFPLEASDLKIGTHTASCFWKRNSYRVFLYFELLFRNPLPTS